MAYSFEIENFLFSSNNPDKVKTVKHWFTGLGYTVDMIKNNEVPERHRLMVDLTLWGHCPMAKDYWRAREIKQDLKKAYVSNFEKGSVSEFWAKGYQGDNVISEQLYNKTGWKF